MKPTIIPYSVFPTQQGSYAYSVSLSVQLALPLAHAPRTKRFEAIIDSGATRCLFDWSIAEFLGIDRASCKSENTTGIGGTERVYLREMSLYIPGGPVTLSAGFKTGLPVAGLLGMSGFFEHFRITFDPIGKACELERIFQV